MYIIKKFIITDIQDVSKRSMHNENYPITFYNCIFGEMRFDDFLA